MESTLLSQVIDQVRKAALLPDRARMSDGQLLECYVTSREEAAFEALLRRHGAMVLAVCRRITANAQDAEDAFQATFLVFVKKAPSIRPPERVANWLYGVAYRAALKARALTARRRRKEKPLTESTGAQAVPHEDIWRNLRPLLDQALSRLPDKYRLPVVLCDLEGKTGKEAAQQLGCPEGTVCSRLSRARALLAKRLSRHGLALSAGSLSALLCGKEASACVPGSLLLSTANAARLYWAGKAIVGGAIPMNVVGLTKGTLNAMFWNKFAKVGAVVLTAVVLSAGSGLLFGPLLARGPDGEKTALEAAETDKETVSTVTSTEFRLAYWHNEASADEKFTDKKVRITGRMSRVKRGGRGNSPARQDGNPQPRGYQLTIEGRIFGLPNPPNPEGPDISLVFQFPYEARKELAGLTRGQKVTIEGRCLGRSGTQQEQIIIRDCKIIESSP